MLLGVSSASTNFSSKKEAVHHQLQPTNIFAKKSGTLSVTTSTQQNSLQVDWNEHRSLEQASAVTEPVGQFVPFVYPC